VRKLLVANRGEIACRIMRSARSLDIKTVAVFSEADREALHVRSSDEAYPIGPSPAKESYLSASKILEVARSSGADAIHPGYGFLSENAAFAEKVLQSGLQWVGPAPEAIRLMGDKQTARDTAQQAGLPIVPGSRRFVPGQLTGLDEAARQVGFPLLIKAAAGGGGIGMRQANGLDGLDRHVVGVQEAAQKSFGNGDVYLERFIPKARHVEIQVFGFGDGRAMHLFERDCSLQRRFQKIIEETPAPLLPDDVRHRMYEASLALCRKICYAGAGTVEFIVDAETHEFFFLEMNTRIQVEHPITEMVTNLDLVSMQLALTSGRTDALPQEANKKGCAVECRLYAENPAKTFFPSPGRLDTFKLPLSTPNIRIDTGYREGDTITPFYDPLIAKIIARGDTRDQAISNAISALADTIVSGITTNRDFLIECLKNDAFLLGDVHTRFVEDHHDELIPKMHQRYR